MVDECLTPPLSAVLSAADSSVSAAADAAMRRTGEEWGEAALCGTEQL